MINPLTKKITKELIRLLPVERVLLHNDIVSISLEKNKLLNSLFMLKNHVNFQYKSLACISGVDSLNKKERFKIVYDLLSVRYNNRITVKVISNELDTVPSACEVFLAAGWYESEVWDMFGVFFQNHTGLTRLLTDYGFEGYPLRKDFPLSGFVEANYDFTQKQVLNSRLELSQEYKPFSFKSPWEN